MIASSTLFFNAALIQGTPLLCCLVQMNEKASAQQHFEHNPSCQNKCWPYTFLQTTYMLKLCFFSFNFALMVRLGLNTKLSWLGLGKDHVLA